MKGVIQKVSVCLIEPIKGYPVHTTHLSHVILGWLGYASTIVAVTVLEKGQCENKISKRFGWAYSVNQAKESTVSPLISG